MVHLIWIYNYFYLKILFFYLQFYVFLIFNWYIYIYIYNIKKLIKKLWTKFYMFNNQLNHILK